MLLLLHGSHLHRRGLGAEQDIFGDIEGVLRIAGGVVFGDVQFFKIIVVILHLGAFHNVKAHAGKDRAKLVLHLGERMPFPHGRTDAGRRDIHLFKEQTGGKRFFAQRFLSLGDLILDHGAHFVGKRADHGAFLGRERSHPAQHAGEFPFLAQIFDPGVFQLALVPDFVQFVGGLVFHGKKQIFHGKSFLTLVYALWKSRKPKKKRTKKKLFTPLPAHRAKSRKASRGTTRFQ